MAVKRTQVLIVGEPGRMQESLRTLLRAVPDLEVMGAEEGSRPLPEAASVDSPDLVLLDFSRPAGEGTQEVAWIRAHWPKASCLVLADTARQVQAAKAAGADGVLLRGFAADEFFAKVRELLKEKIRLDAELAPSSGPAKGNSLDSGASLIEARALRVSPVVF